ncbi:MAG: 50S ribosomal protein L4 [Thermoplasmata archaeon]|nr:50S ribosomal protein L4 [Thermoplasmata archaeon]MCK4454868.1 50S ribosomal protein L4 [Thermoplasmata archaeon]
MAKKRKENEVNVYSVEGKVVRTIELPGVFMTGVRTDLIRRAVVSAQANRRQSYGPNPMSGMRHAVSTWGKGRGVSRVQRITGQRTAAQSPGTVGGRKAHPPRPGHDWSKKINKKERVMARASALAATKDVGLVSKRGHVFDADLTLPVVVEDDIELLKTTQEAVELLKSINVFDDVLRARERKIRAGRGKMRARKYRRPTSILVALSSSSESSRAFTNIPGVDVSTSRHLNTEILAPGGEPGRLVLFSESALEEVRAW